MKVAVFVAVATALWMLAAPHAEAQSPSINPLRLAKIVPGRSNKTDVRSLLGAPWRVVQFNDCGMAMDGQADETWEYRGADAGGGYRVHIEFGDDNAVHLIAKIPDAVAGGKPVTAKTEPATSARGMSM
ncbi:MAG: hypothetical protein WBD71_19880 [Xanthobacteraceae bacterium]